MSTRRKRPDRASAAPPDSATLHEAALAYLARYAATEVALRRVLDRRVERWARTAAGDRDMIESQAAEAKRAAASVVARLAEIGAVDDAAFAESRARSLVRAGRSRQAIAGTLAAKGVDAATRHRILEGGDAGNELAAALALARRRRVGPFRSGDAPDPEALRRELAVLARAGFPQSIARRALDMPRAEAEELVDQLRR